MIVCGVAVWCDVMWLYIMMAVRDLVWLCVVWSHCVLLPVARKGFKMMKWK